MKIKSITTIDKPSIMYDMYIPDANSYYANNILVHNSNANLGEALALKGIDTKQRTTKGDMQLTKETLASLNLPITDLILKRKSLKKALSTYIKKFTETDLGKVRYKLFDTATARLSSGNDLSKKSKANYYFLPLNFQNLTKSKTAIFEAYPSSDPKNSILGYEFVEVDQEYLKNNGYPDVESFANYDFGKTDITHEDKVKAFMKLHKDKKFVDGFQQDRNLRNAITTPDDTWVMSSIDFSAQELRVLTNMFRPKVFLEAFRNNEDLHEKMAKVIWGEANYNKDKRAKAKSVNFGIAYGAVAYTFFQRGVTKTVEEAESLLSDFWKANPDLERGQQQLIKQLYRDNGVVHNMFGRPRRVKHSLTSSNKWEREGGEREALNYVIQSTCADVIRMVLYELYKQIFSNPDNHDEIRFSGTIHDEVLYLIKKEHINKWLPKIVNIMEQKNLGEIPLVVEVELGTSYGNRWVFDQQPDETWLPRFK